MSVTMSVSFIFVDCFRGMTELSHTGDHDRLLDEPLEYGHVQHELLERLLIPSPDAAMR